MTAEIGVLNKQAIALAADSAVTIRGAHGQKIYNHANKLFMLCCFSSAFYLKALFYLRLVI
ncbi:hypothetical protein BSK56_06415 [Paenibacillus borealis]|uniref:Uncharacterized protein n=1 Tax=Paenibacillus borealis TaxID=160799 RepID=A0ABX3HJJ2_PAEBO|nr:hypothetical protein BSK56_06415 [Paenibacillus borealis]